MKHFLEQVIPVVSSARANIMSVRVPVAGTLEKVTVYVNGNVASTNTFDANLNGGSVFSNQAHRPSITSGNQSAQNGAALAQAVAAGDKLSIDADVVNEAMQFVTVVFQIEDGVNYALREVLQNVQSEDYTAVLSDSGKQILHPSSDNNARTFTIPANINVPFPIGTVITFVNEINTVVIAIDSDTLVFAESGVAGSRNLSANGLATAMKIGATRWQIAGAGLS